MRSAVPLLAALVLAATAPVHGQTITGVLLDDATGQPIPGGTVVLLTGDSVQIQSVLTDDDGGFVLQAPEPAAYRLAAERIGYRSAASPPIEMGDDTLMVEFRLSVDAVVLEPVTVIADSRRPVGMLKGFYDRMERGLGGTFIAREEIERRNPLRASDLLEGVAGVQIIRAPGGRGIAVMRGRCVPNIYVDGLRIIGGSIDDVVFPADLEGIEIYRSAAGLPVEFSGQGSGCGAIALWTRRGP